MNEMHAWQALRMNRVLNEFGIFYNLGTAGNRTVPGDPVPGCFDIADETAIFRLLDMKYLRPHERNAGSRSGGDSERGGAVLEGATMDSSDSESERFFADD